MAPNVVNVFSCALIPKAVLNSYGVCSFQGQCFHPGDQVILS